MTLRLDKFGRLLLPLAVRKKLGIGPGAELAIEIDEDAIVLTPRRQAGTLVRERGVLVWDGPAFEEIEAVRRDRAERDARTLGG
ncbi:MAG: AbrB/MazE/SpoVT family DNA-binding domain-containing protein [Armatimonadota bacterium]|nr:AbrB/MazE/SpoVT family DNA-binding domain-containing protein [Armatimonadota bacterium]